MFLTHYFTGCNCSLSSPFFKINTNANNWLIIIHNDIMLEVDGPPSSHFSVKGELNLAFKRFFLNKITHQCWFPYVEEWMSEELWVFSIDMRVNGKALRGTEISSPFTLRNFKWTPLAHTMILAPILNRSLAWTRCVLHSCFIKSNTDNDVI